MKKYFYPSMMCADFSNLKNEVEALDKSGIDGYHMDVMDGQFVPNFGLGPEDFKGLTKLTSKPYDAHLMINHPSNYIKLFASLGATVIYVHFESELNPLRSIMELRKLKVHPGIAINPDTSFESIREILPFVDNVLVMTVNPGFAGQTFIKEVEEKLTKIVRLKEQYGYQVTVDGALSPEKIDSLGDLGTDGFVLGTSALFGKTKSYKQIMDVLKND